MIISSLLFVFILVSFGFWVSTYCKIEEKYTPLISVGTFICLGVCFGILNVLSVGIGILYVVLLLGGGIAIYKRRQEFCKYIFSLPIVCFITSCFFIMILFSVKQPFFVAWDEFSHWGPFLKNLKQTGELHIYAENYFVHQTYVQGIPVFYYLSSYFDNIYKEESVYFAYSILLHACAVTVVPNMPVNKNWKSSSLYILFIPLFWYLFPYAYYAAPYTCSYLDVMLGALFGGTILYIINNLQENMWCPKKVWSLGIMFFAILQIKDISIAFYLICLATCTINLLYQLIERKTDTNKCKLRMIIMHILFTVVIPLTGKLAWSTILERTGKNTDQFSGSKVDKVVELFSSYINGENDYFGQVLDAFLSGLRSVNISWTGTVIPVIVFAILVFSFIIGYSKRKWNQNKIVGIHLALFPMYFLCYLLVLFVVYLCSMSIEEALSNASMDRYIGCFVAGWTMVLFGLILGVLYEYKEKVAIGLVAVATLYIYLTIPLNNVNYWNLTKEETGLEWYESKSEVCMEIMDSGADIWLITSGNEEWLRKYIFLYTMMPNEINIELPADDTPYSSAEIMQRAIDNGIEYFLVIDSKQEFKEKFSEYINISNDAGDERCMLVKFVADDALEQVY